MAKKASARPAFDLETYAKTVHPAEDIPSYADLQRTQSIGMKRFVGGLRKKANECKKKGKEHIFVVLGTGGTFQSDERKEDGALAPIVSLEKSFKALGLPEDPKVETVLHDLMVIDSSQMTVEQWRFLADMIVLLENKASDSYDAIIITHGTDTMAKGAAYLAFMLKGFPKSIIFTGSQEPAVKEGSDAKDQMDRSITTAKLSCNVNRRITEVMVSCGSRVTRGVWAAKLGDETVNAFGPWNQPDRDFDASDLAQVGSEEEVYRLAPALLDFGTSKGKAGLHFAPHAISYEKKGAFEPFTEIVAPVDLFPATLTDKSPIALALHIINQKVSVLIQLGSATADDSLIKVALEAARCGKAVLLAAPFFDSSLVPGKYAAGRAVLTPLKNIQRRLPIINTSPAGLEAKVNFLIHRLQMQSAKKVVENMGVCYSLEDLRRFYDHMEQSYVGELV